MKRIFDDHGLWNPEAHASGNRARPLIQQAFDLLRNEGYNPREAQHMIESVVQEETLVRVLDIKYRLEQLRSGHAQADAAFTPAHKQRAFDLMKGGVTTDSEPA